MVSLSPQAPIRCALVEKYLGLPLLASLPVAAVVGAHRSAWLLPFPSRNLSGIYLAVATMALALALPELLLHFSADFGWLRRACTSSLTRCPACPSPCSATTCRSLGLVVVVVLLRHFRRSRQAMALLLIRTSAHAAESFGVRRSWARLSCMALERLDRGDRRRTAVLQFFHGLAQQLHAVDLDLPAGRLGGLPLLDLVSRAASSVACSSR